MLKPRIKVAVLSLFCCLLSLFVSQAESQAQSKDTKEGRAEVSGRVTLKGEPARGVTVALLPQQQAGPSNQNSAWRSKTDAKGTFHITKVPAGQYMISAVAPGFVTSNDSSFYRLEGKSIGISDGEIIENIEFSLKRGSVITGRVTDENGQPIIEEVVRLAKVDEQGKPVPSNFSVSINLSTNRTDDRGIYRLYGLPAGRYLVSISGGQRFTGSSNRKYYPQTFHPDAAEESKAKVIELGEGEEATDIDISVGEEKKKFQVIGRVIDAESGQPLEELEIQLGAYRPNSKGMAAWTQTYIQSGPEGEFRLNGVSTGKYAIITASGNNPEYYSDPVPFEVIDSDVSGIEVKAKRGATISGSVVVEGSSDPAVLAKLPLLELYAYPRSEQEPRTPISSRINMDGGFRLTGLYPGKVQISLADYGAGREFSMIRLERGGSLLPAEIEVGPGEQINNFRVVVGYGSAELRGQLQISGSSLPEGGSWQVLVVRSGGPTSANFSGEVDARGQFSIKSLLPGEYELRIGYNNRSNPAAVDQQLMREISRFRQRVTIINGVENKVTLNLNLTRREENR